jgi:hypothetical protein
MLVKSKFAGASLMEQSGCQVQFLFENCLRVNKQTAERFALPFFEVLSSPVMSCPVLSC